MREIQVQQEFTEIGLETSGPGAHDITDVVLRWVESTGIREGLLSLYIRHTSASLMIQENYDPEVLRDMERFLARLVPKGDPLFRHTMEGPDDMPAHVRSALTNTSLSIPVRENAPQLGQWQGIFVYEHRDRPHGRSVALHLMGER
jgi:secondary thiamine-phosphate synthase enzyme